MHCSIKHLLLSLSVLLLHLSLIKKQTKLISSVLAGKEMAIQAQLHYNASNVNQIGTGGSLLNNNGGIGIDQSYMNNHNLLSQKDLNQHALFQHQQYRSQSVLDAYMERQKQEIDQFIRVQVRNHIILPKRFGF